MAAGWRENQNQQLREHLYQTSLRLFREMGFDNATLSRITEEAGVAKGTFFNYYASKEHVLTEWYRRLTAEALAHAEATEHATVLEALDALAADLASRCMETPDLWAMKTLQASARTEILAQEASLDEDLQEYCRRWIDLGRSRGEIDSELDADAFIGLFIAVLTGTGHNWVIANQSFDLKAVVRQRVAFLFRAAQSA